MGSSRGQTRRDVGPGTTKLIANKRVRVLIPNPVIPVERAPDLILGNQRIPASAQQRRHTTSDQHHRRPPAHIPIAHHKPQKSSHKTVYHTCNHVWYTGGGERDACESTLPGRPPALRSLPGRFTQSYTINGLVCSILPQRLLQNRNITHRKPPHAGRWSPSTSPTRPSATN